MTCPKKDKILENCTKINCNLKHPVECSFYNQFKRFKFLKCIYKQIQEVSSNEFNKLQEKMTKLEVMFKINYNDKCFQCKKCDHILKSESELQKKSLFGR